MIAFTGPAPKLTGLFLLLAVTAGCDPSGSAAERAKSEQEVKSVIDSYYSGLANREPARVNGALTDNLLIYENGKVTDSLEEYGAYHIHVDIRMMSSVKRTVIEQRISVMDDFAVSFTKSQLKGRFRRQDIDQTILETMHLVKADEQWKISHIHWSD